MLTNTERQQIVEEVNAGTYGIDEALDDIAVAQKGEEVRKALYAEALALNREGHAGSTDMIARQQIANLQTSVNGQISTLRTEVGEDIDDLETALNSRLNSSLATQNGKIAAQDATIANVVANYNVEYGSTELWASTGETGALAAGTTVTLSEDVSHFDYIDIYSFCGNSNVLDTVPVDAKLQSSQGYALRWVNLSDPGSGTYEAYVRIVETKIKIIGTTLTIVHQVTYRNGESVSVSGAEITQSNRSTYVGELGIMKVVGRKITANTEIEDVRVGADGTEYASAGQAVRTQVQELHDLANNIPAVDDTLSTTGAAADAAAVGAALAAASGGSGMTEAVKQALLACFTKVAWIDDSGQNCYDALETAMYPPVNLTRITAVYTQPGVVYDSASLDSLRGNLVVTAYYEDSTTATVSDYTLSGTLTAGTSTVTAVYGGKTATFTVTVTEYSTAPVIETANKTWNQSGTLSDAPGYGVTPLYSYTFDVNDIQASRFYDAENDYMSTSGWCGIKYFVTTANTNAAGYSAPATRNYKHYMRGEHNGKTNWTYFSITKDQESNSKFDRYKSGLLGAIEISFTLASLDLDDCYAYWKADWSTSNGGVYPIGVQEGDIIFAGRNTPYYGKTNIND